MFKSYCSKSRNYFNTQASIALVTKRLTSLTYGPLALNSEGMGLSPVHAYIWDTQSTYHNKILLLERMHKCSHL